MLIATSGDLVTKENSMIVYVDIYFEQKIGLYFRNGQCLRVLLAI